MAVAEDKRKSPPATTSGASTHRERANRREREASESVRDIGELPAVVNPARREACRNDLALFLKTYFPGTFRFPFSADHLSVIAKTQKVIVEGGLHAVAMPRGFGKTSISEGAALWAILFGYRFYVVVIGATSEASTDIMEAIKEEVETNELLLEDFPEAIFPMQALDGEPRRCLGQTYKGTKTRTQWGQKRLKFPTMPGSASSGAMIRVAGITGQVRGKRGKVLREGGAETFRPDLVLLDDVQTESSALSDVKCRTRERIISGSVLGLAGRGKKIAALMLCTVIKAGDVSDRHLDHKIHPEWNGSRHKMLYKFPSNMKLWEEYKEIRLSFNPSTPGEKEEAEQRATEFYIDHQAEMDAGAIVAWEHGYLPDEVSALQSAMNLWITNPRAFAAEAQNDPLPEEDACAAPLTALEIAAKLNGLPRRHVPLTATRVTAAIDVQKGLLFWIVVAWEENFTGYIIDYGSFPEQGRVYFTKADAGQTIAKATKVPGFEGQIYAGLVAVCEKILGKDYPRGDGGKTRVERCLIDANYGDSTNVVYQFCLQSQFAALLTPQHGKGIGASGRSMSAYPKKTGERHDPNGMWILTQAPQRREVKYALTDTNAWKSFIYKRFAVAMGSPGCLSLWGKDATVHSMFADHITAEHPVDEESKTTGRKIDVWKAIVGRDNDFFDCLVYASAAASIQGVVLKEGAKPKAARGPRLTLQEMKARANGNKK